RAAVDLPLPQAAPPAAAAMPAAATFPAPSAPEASLAAFLHGAGLGDVRLADPTATMEMLGATFRTFVSGLRETMIARAAVKSEMRIEATQIRSGGNNPLKFAADDNDALVALIGAGRRTEMGPVAAVNDALRDLRLHELATIAAMQSAVRSLLAEFDPQKLRLAAERGGFELVAMQKKASAWDRFEALHGTVTAALSDNFDSVFGRAFARAYERALAEASVKD
ncbi:MAG: type VI secretion system-associated FHA domain protein TagH, partial [Stellaceae bacterium]